MERELQGQDQSQTKALGLSSEGTDQMVQQIAQLQVSGPEIFILASAGPSTSSSSQIFTPASEASEVEAPAIAIKSIFQLDIVNPYRMVGVTTQEDMDIQVIQFKNRQMGLNLQFRVKREEEIRGQIAQLEAKQEQKDLFFDCMSRHWSTVNTDILNLLCIIDDASLASELAFKFQPTEDSNPLHHDAHENLVTQIQSAASWISQIMLVFNQLYDKRMRLLMGLEDNEEMRRNQKLRTEFENGVKMHRITALQMWEVQDNLALAKTKIQEYCEWLESQGIRKADLAARNKNLQLQVRELQDSITQMKNDIELAEKQKKRLEDEAQQRKMRLTSIERQLTRDREELQRLHQEQGSYEAEIEAMGLRHEELEKEIKKVRLLKTELNNVADADVFETQAYKQLQAKFSVMFNELLRLRDNCVDARKKYDKLTEVSQSQVQDMQRKTASDTAELKTEIGHMQSSLSTIRMEYSGLLDKYAPVKEEIGQNSTISREMRSLLPTLQDHNRKLGEDVVLHKKKCEGMSTEIEKLRRDTKKLRTEYERRKIMKPTADAEIGTEPRQGTSASFARTGHAEDNSTSEAHAALIKKLQAELVEGEADNRELRMLLDLKKSVGKDGRSAAHLRKLEAIAKAEAAGLREELKKLTTPTPNEALQLTQEQSNEQIATLESQIRSLRAETARAMEMERALSDEVESRGQNFDALQSQSARLTEELAKINANNMRIMSQGNKIGEITKQHWNEIKQLKEQAYELNQCLEEGQKTVKWLEAKTNSMMKGVLAGEMKSIEGHNLSEKNRLAALHNVQSSADLQESVDSAKIEWEEISAIASEKQAKYDEACAATKSMQDEAEQLRREVEELEATEEAAAAAANTTTASPNTRQSSQLREIAEYKTVLTCPSCKVARKDAFLSTCFHAFCYECLRTRYANRDRKCPQCNRAFGAADYHRLQLE